MTDKKTVTHIFNSFLAEDIINIINEIRQYDDNPIFQYSTSLLGGKLLYSLLYSFRIDYNKIDKFKVFMKKYNYASGGFVIDNKRTPN